MRQLLTNSSLVRTPSLLVSNLLKAISTLSLSCLALISMQGREEGDIQDMVVISTLTESLLLGK